MRLLPILVVTVSLLAACTGGGATVPTPTGCPSQPELDKTATVEASTARALGTRTPEQKLICFSYIS